MLKLTQIKKSYQTGDFIQHALKGIDLEFQKNEFVAILGASGSGKTTLLNIIGGLDRYDSGDLIINGKSTKQFKSSDWDAYRNNCIGFVFQSYNLINHISVLENVEMGMTLSGISVKKRRQKALEVLEKVGLKEHAHKKPNQLSGGQMQRVAIARALANNPDIILADEPTGALDSITSVQIMELIKEVAKDKLVIMVTHNADLANTYASRVVELRDGEVIKDSLSSSSREEEKTHFKIKKTAMSYLTALKLSFNNIITKKGRTLLTAFASSIGIIGIALILSLSNGFDLQIDKFERETLSSLPIMITQQAGNVDEETMQQLQENMTDTSQDYPSETVIYPQKPVLDVLMHKNNFTDEYLEYIENIEPSLVSGIGYTRMTNLNIISKVNGKYLPISTLELGFSPIPKTLKGSNTSVIEQNYDILAGRMPENSHELLLILDSKNRLTTTLLSALGLDSTKETISFEEALNIELKLLLNDEYYLSLGGHFTINPNFEALYNSDKAISLKVVGIIRGKEGNKLYSGTTGVAYTEDLIEEIVEKNKNSAIVLAQEKENYNILTGEQFDVTESETNFNTKEMMMTMLGANTIPMVINIYPKDFDAKDEIITYLDKYNEDKSADDRIIYSDLASMISSLSGNIMNAITIVLVAFSAISLVVSSIMIGIITYISVLERTKEIGILRALGARKKDISRVFNAETFIIGLTSGLIGLCIARLLIFPTNDIIEGLTDLANVAKMNPIHAIILLLVSITLTVIGGWIPAKIASKKDPVEALRTE